MVICPLLFDGQRTALPTQLVRQGAIGPNRHGVRGGNDPKRVQVGMESDSTSAQSSSGSNLWMSLLVTPPKTAVMSALKRREGSGWKVGQRRRAGLLDASLFPV